MQHIIANSDKLTQQNSLEEKLREFMASKDIPIFDDEISLDGTIKRFSSRQNGKKSEWYIGHEIEPNKYIVVFASWRQSEQKYYFRSYQEGAVSNEKLKMEMIEDKIIEEQNKIEKEQQKKIRDFFPKAQPCLEHPYLTKKKINPHICKQKGTTLIIPMQDINGELSSLQYIFSDGNGSFSKRFKGGISTKGLFAIIGDFQNQKKYIVCEGFATGASIHENTAKPVIIAFSADNCLSVQAFLQQRYPEKIGELAADNDEKGLKIAQQWEKFFKTKVYVPTKEGYDFNDLYNELPKEEVNKLFQTKSIKPLTIDFVLEEEIQPEVWLNSIIREGTFNIIFGTGGLGKSRLAYEMAFCLGKKEQFLFFETFGSYRCLYVDGEMTPFQIKSRLQEIADRHQADQYEVQNFKIVRSKDVRNQLKQDMDLFQREHRESLNEAFKTIDIIFLDNFGSLTIPPSGDSYKLDKVEWIKFFSWIKSWTEKGKTFVLIMHANKDGKLEGIGKIRNDADLVLELKKPVDIDTRASCHFEVWFDKARDLPIHKQKPFTSKLFPNQQKFFGWDCQTR